MYELIVSLKQLSRESACFTSLAVQEHESEGGSHIQFANVQMCS